MLQNQNNILFFHPRIESYLSIIQLWKQLYWQELTN